MAAIEQPAQEDAAGSPRGGKKIEEVPDHHRFL